MLNTLRTRRPLKPDEGDEILEEPHGPHPVRNIVNLLQRICTIPRGYFQVFFRDIRRIHAHSGAITLINYSIPGLGSARRRTVEV